MSYELRQQMVSFEEQKNMYKLSSLIIAEKKRMETMTICRLFRQIKTEKGTFLLFGKENVV